MFGSAKPIASLSSGLLARKGHARPAMKPQGFAGFNAATSLEDLGWNDMGEAEPQPDAAVAPLPPVLVKREELEAAVAVPVPETAQTPSPVPVPPEPAAEAPIAPETVARIVREARRIGRSAAFTLRLPADRHLRLRLASAVQLRSAQLVVTDALDRYLASLPQIDELARRATPAEE